MPPAGHNRTAPWRRLSWSKGTILVLGQKVTLPLPAQLMRSSLMSTYWVIFSAARMSLTANQWPWLRALRTWGPPKTLRSYKQSSPTRSEVQNVLPPYFFNTVLIALFPKKTSSPIWNLVYSFRLTTAKYLVHKCPEAGRKEWSRICG